MHSQNLWLTSFQRKNIDEGTNYIQIGYSFIALGISFGVIVSLYNNEQDLISQSFIKIYEEKCFDSFTNGIQDVHDKTILNSENAVRINLFLLDYSLCIFRKFINGYLCYF